MLNMAAFTSSAPRVHLEGRAFVLGNHMQKTADAAMSQTLEHRRFARFFSTVYATCSTVAEAIVADDMPEAGLPSKNGQSV